MATGEYPRQLPEKDIRDIQADGKLIGTVRWNDACNGERNLSSRFTKQQIEHLWKEKGNVPLLFSGFKVQQGKQEGRVLGYVLRTPEEMQQLFGWIFWEFQEVKVFMIPQELPQK